MFRTRRSTVLARFRGPTAARSPASVRVGADGAASPGEASVISLSSMSYKAMAVVAAGLAVLAVGTIWIVFRK